MNEANSKGLWLHYKLSSPPMWQWEWLQDSYNPCEHSRTKYIDIWHHFLREHAIKVDIIISHVRTNEQLVDIFTKPLDEKRFWEPRSELNIIDSQNEVWKVAHLKCFLSCLVVSLKFFENSFLYSKDDLIAYRFMLVHIMLFLLSSMPCMQIFSKFCPQDQLSAKLWSNDQVISSRTFWILFQV
jgi:hypothetical protein